MALPINNLFHEDALVTMSKIHKEVDLILTSPPYNTSRANSKDKYNKRYSYYSDTMEDQEYIDWTIKIFNGYGKVLKTNGVVLYNLSYSTEKPALMYLVIAAIIDKTEFTVADTIIWKKPKGMPNNRSSNRLTRITETIYVLCRKSELKTFKTNKQVKTLMRTGQKNYENITNYIEARNNDGSNKLNKAIFSSELVGKLIDIYAPSDFSVVYDSFSGTGTTAKTALDKNMFFIASEIDPKQVIEFRDYFAKIPLGKMRKYKINMLLHELKE